VAMAVHWSFVGGIGALGALGGGWIKDHFPPAWGAFAVPGGAPLSYFHIIIALQVLLAWAVVVPMFWTLREPGRQPG